MSSARELRPLVRRLLSDAFWTLVHNAAAVLGGLALVKLISALVPAREFGQASLVLGVVALPTQLVASPLLPAHLRLWFDHGRTESTAEFLRAIEPALLRCAAIMAALYMAIAIGYRIARHHGCLRLAIPALLLIVLTPHVNAAFSLLEARRRYRDLALGQTLARVAPVLFLAGLLALPLSRSSSVVLAHALGLGLVFMV